ncbi:unnamed protein product [Cuscuta europaea]|uniref:Uncharacterized protein n=1 Tax=Cuscuta europaea TaxID=41803 RepID=A0A9P1E0S5_CUSEU|nr:unnamed protein product [Cuscuta europaea]
MGWNYKRRLNIQKKKKKNKKKKTWSSNWSKKRIIKPNFKKMNAEYGRRRRSSPQSGGKARFWREARLLRRFGGWGLVTHSPPHQHAQPPLGSINRSIYFIVNG